MVWLSEAALWHDTSINSPDKARPHVNLGNALLTMGLTEQAIHEYKFAKERGPANLMDVYMGLGGAYLLKQDWNGAIQEFQAAVAIKPDSSLARTNLGLAFMNKGLLKQAIAEFQLAIEIWPDNYGAHQNLSIAYKKAGLLHESEEETKIADTLKQLSPIQGIQGYGIIHK
jgi:tetratricopeptide (TPR) repeat protein